jgi:hypothetical protein
LQNSQPRHSNTTETCKLANYKNDTQKKTGTSDNSENENDNDNLNEHAWSALLSTATETNKTSWVLDSGATRHFVNDKTLMEQIQPLYESTLTTATNEKLTINQIGTSSIKLNNKYKQPLKDVAYVPTFVTNLLSVSQIVDSGAIVIFTKSKALIKHNGKLITTIPRSGNLFILNINNKVDTKETTFYTTVEKRR